MRPSRRRARSGRFSEPAQLVSDHGPALTHAMEKLVASEESTDGDALIMPLLVSMVISKTFAAGKSPIAREAPAIVAKQVPVCAV